MQQADNGGQSQKAHTETPEGTWARKEKKSKGQKEESKEKRTEVGGEAQRERRLEVKKERPKEEKETKRVYYVGVSKLIGSSRRSIP